jgi:capsular polysaccharide transport system permease protein
MHIVPILGATRRWCGKILLLISENFGFRYRRSRLGAILAILEPLGIIAVISFAQSLLTHYPPFGTSIVLFHATGILPFYAMLHVARRTRQMDDMLMVPTVSQFDVLLSHVFAEYLVKVVLGLVIMTGLFLYGVREAVPFDPMRPLMAMLVLAILGMGIGMNLVAITSFFVELRYLWPPLLRALMIFSGAMQVMEYTPEPLRTILDYNPISHGIAWFRTGVYPTYPTTMMDLPYLFTWTGILLFVGWTLETATRGWRRAS